MSEMGEFWRDVNGYGKQKRHSNMKSSTDLLTNQNIPFVSHNNGIHLVVLDRWDFWPSTGLFIDRKTSKKGRGVKNLLRIAKSI